jgi:hypothetical protein
MKQHSEQLSRLQRDYKEEVAKNSILQKQLQENERRFVQFELLVIGSVSGLNIYLILILEWRSWRKILKNFHRKIKNLN